MGEWLLIRYNIVMSEEIIIASDHAGYELKEHIKNYLQNNKYEVKDLGCNSLDSVNYPDYAHQVAKEVLATKARGILVCGSGIGMSMAANRHEGIRAALCTSVEYAKLSREHNDSNILVMGARFIDKELAESIVNTWLNTEFAGGRHQLRVDLIEEK